MVSCERLMRLQVYMKKKRGSSERRCWRSARFLRLKAGCHHVSIMHAHSGGEHGITLRVQVRAYYMLAERTYGGAQTADLHDTCVATRLAAVQSCLETSTAAQMQVTDVTGSHMCADQAQLEVFEARDAACACGAHHPPRRLPVRRAATAQPRPPRPAPRAAAAAPGGRGEDMPARGAGRHGLGAVRVVPAVQAAQRTKGRDRSRGRVRPGRALCLPVLSKCMQTGE